MALRRARSFVALAVLAWGVAVGSSPSAWAQGAKDPVAAESLFQEGKTLMEEGKLDEACAKFAASMAAEESPGTLLNLARCHQEQGKLATAWAEYKRAAPMFRARGEPDREDAARELAEELAPKLSQLTIAVEAPVPGLVITRDGDVVNASLYGAPVPVDPGSHKIEASAPGYLPFSTEVSVGLDADKQSVTVLALSVDPNAATETPDPAIPPEEGGGMSTQAIIGLGVTGVGVVVLAVGGILGITVLGDASAAEDDDTLCPNKVCSPAGREAIDSAEGKALASNILIGVGAAATIGGVILFLTAPSDEPAVEVGGVRARPAGSFDGGGFWLDGSF